MRNRLTLVIIAALLAGAPSPLRAGEPEPDCRGTRLSAGYTRIAIAGQALILLNGSEDPRLPKVLEMWLSSSVDYTEGVLKEGAQPSAMYPAPNLSESARRASVYARAHMSESLALRLEHLAALIKPGHEENQAPK